MIMIIRGYSAKENLFICETEDARMIEVFLSDKQRLELDPRVGLPFQAEKRSVIHRVEDVKKL